MSGPESGLLEDAGKSDAPGRPTMYRVTNEFLKMFGYSSIDELPDLPTIEENSINLTESKEEGEN